MTDAALAGSAARVSSRWFYAWMAMTCAAIAVLGFMPTYFLPMAQAKFQAEPIVHIHGLIMFSWCALFVTQTWLVAKGGTLAHRNWGMLGVAIIAAMTCVVTAVVAMRISQAEWVQANQAAAPATFAHDVRAFEWVPFSGLVYLVPMFVLAIVNVKKPEAHKRFMLLGTISMLAAPIARWFLVFMAPPPDPNAPVILMPDGLPAPAVPPVFVAIPPALVGDVLWIIAMIYDWRTRGNVHPVYIWGGAVLLVMQLTVIQVADSGIWQGFASALGHLAG
ncbi:MAG TPA: hypothetical protein VG942_11530 [Hyphomonadaceae bacterium]|nr:hypothetical protein [Hyphomonadaceae bacterium]